MSDTARPDPASVAFDVTLASGRRETFTSFAGRIHRRVRDGDAYGRGVAASAGATWVRTGQPMLYAFDDRGRRGVALAYDDGDARLVRSGLFRLDRMDVALVAPEVGRRAVPGMEEVASVRVVVPGLVDGSADRVALSHAARKAFEWTDAQAVRAGTRRPGPDLGGIAAALDSDGGDLGCRRALAALTALHSAAVEALRALDAWRLSEVSTRGVPPALTLSAGASGALGALLSNLGRRTFEAERSGT